MERLFEYGPAHTGNTLGAKYSKDFRSVHWFGTDYSFTPIQAACIKVLWDAWAQGTLELGQQTILEEADADGNRLSDVFRASPAWKTMIVKGTTKGSYRLNDSI